MDFDVVALLEQTAVLRNKVTGEILEVLKTPDIIELGNKIPASTSKIKSAKTDELDEEDMTSSSTKAVWSVDATEKLIHLYKKYASKFQSGFMRKDEVWKMIAQELISECFHFTAKQCEFKWKHLRKLYMKTVDNMGAKGSGESPITFKYFELMDQIFSEKPNVKPVALASSSKGMLPVVNSNDKENACPAKKSKFADVLKYLEEKDMKKEEGRNMRHKERMALQRDALEQFANILMSQKK